MQRTIAAELSGISCPVFSHDFFIARGMFCGFKNSSQSGSMKALKGAAVIEA